MDEKRDRMTNAVRKDNLRKKNGERDRKTSVFRWLGFSGIVGWSVAVPTVLFTMFGIWLDRSYPSRISWTITLLLVGVVTGCVIAWNWISKARRGG
ncbi:MAG: AtpZ/AtpI family protein [Spirochaetes bacterium]|nr:AtpZ/AtpI family protein [Spirochaetota bacterium]